MSATVTELFADRIQTIESNGKYTSMELFYLASNVVADLQVIYINNVAYPATTEYFALEAVRAIAPRVMYGMARKDLRISEKIDETTYKIGVTYNYSGTESPGNSDNDADAGDRTITFSSSGGTRHITHSYKTINTIGTVPNHEGAINVDHANNINGVDVLSPTLSFTETHYMTYKKFKISYIRDLNSLQGKVNDEQFRGFEAGEVRFDGFSASRRGTKREDLYEITFQFSVIPNQPSQTIQGLEIPAKKGWDYVWFRTKPIAPKPKTNTSGESDGTFGGEGSGGIEESVTNTIEGAYIERIYQLGNFGKLMIKTSPFTAVSNV